MKGGKEQKSAQSWTELGFTKVKIPKSDFHKVEKISFKKMIPFMMGRQAAYYFDGATGNAGRVLNTNCDSTKIQLASLRWCEVNPRRLKPSASSCRAIKAEKITALQSRVTWKKRGGKKVQKLNLPFLRGGWRKPPRH